MEYFEGGLFIIQKINKLGYEAYIVGGYVRDYLLNISSNDIDIATNMPLELIKKNFDYKDNGSNYLSITILLDNLSFEITLFRKDLLYEDHRHPKVEIVNSFKEDVERRDFTINSIAIDGNKKIVDYYNGLDDLKNKIIRLIGDPNKRFEEDALRILRGLYLVSKLGFEIEESTISAMNNNSYLLSKLSNERIYEYFIRIINGNYFKMALGYIEEYNLFDFIPGYKKWIRIADNMYNENELVFIYYIKYHQYPPYISSNQKKLCSNLDDLINNRFDNYSLYQYQNIIDIFGKSLDYLGKSLIALQKQISLFPIRSEKELAVTPLEIASNFEGNMKSTAIKLVIKSILDRKLFNNKTDILTFIKELKYAK